jgi:hypothetical protein
MCQPDELKRLILKYRSSDQLSSDELRTLVEGLDEILQDPKAKGSTEVGASFVLAKIASDIEELQSSIDEYGEEARQNFIKISKVIENSKGVSQ